MNQQDQRKLPGSLKTPPVGDGVGYGVAAIETIQSLQRRRIKVSYDSHEPLVHISFVQPDHYHGLNDQFRVGYTPWESSEVPAWWISHMQEMDEIWTTCTYVENLYREAGVNEVIRVVPHGIDPEVWSVYEREISDKFYFLHIGGPTARKGGQRVVDAFLDVFDGNEDVMLILKSNGPTETRWTDKAGKYRGNAVYHPQIENYHSYFDLDGLVQLHQRCHCMVYPTNGEGFGLIPFQAMATGMPTIVTNGTSCTDFAELAIPLNCTPTKGKGIHLGDWVEPDPDDLRDKMKAVYEDYQSAKNHALQSARIIHSTQTWDHVGQQIEEILGDKVSRRV